MSKGDLVVCLGHGRFGVVCIMFALVLFVQNVASCLRHDGRESSGRHATRCALDEKPAIYTGAVAYVDARPSEVARSV